MTRRIRDHRGATAVEYALMLALLGLVIILSVTVLARNSSSTFNCVGQATQQSDCSKPGCLPSSAKPPKCQL